MGGSSNLRAGRFSIDAFFASPVGTFVGRFASSLGIIVGRMPPVASGTYPSRPCLSWLAILDTVSFNSSIKAHPARLTPAATIRKLALPEHAFQSLVDPQPSGAIRSFAGKLSLARVLSPLLRAWVACARGAR